LIGSGPPKRETSDEENVREFASDSNTAAPPTSWTWQGTQFMSPVFDSGNCSTAGFAFAAVTSSASIAAT